MAVTVLIPSIVSLLAIALVIVTLVIGYIRKIMMTYMIVIANFIVFALSLVFYNEIIGDLGFRPVYLSTEYFPQIYTLLTSIFVHANFLHILGNMLVFFFMGFAFEQRIGPKKFLLIYLITGVIGGLTQSFMNFGSGIILIGASGAIFGILGAFAYSYPRDEVVMPVPIGLMIIMRIKVIYAAIIFAAFETVIVILTPNDTTAHFAHFGGLVSGVILAAIIVGNQGEKIKTPYGVNAHGYIPVSSSTQIDFSHLEQLANTPQMKALLQRVEKENVLQVRDIWLDHFLDKATCPVCGKPLQHAERTVWCQDEHFRIEY